MIQIFNALVPEHYKTTNKLFLYYLKTMKDKLYKVSLPEISCFEIQVLKNLNSFTVVIHQNYKSEVSTVSIHQIEKMLPIEPINDKNLELEFINQLRF